VSATAPREERERDEGELVQLRDRNDAQGRKAERATSAEQADDPEQHEDGRPDVKAIEDESGRERERQGREHERSGGELYCVGAGEEQGDDEEYDCRSAKSEHEDAETVVVTVIRGRRREKDRQSSRGILQSEVAVRNLPVKRVLRVAEVMLDVTPVGQGEQACGRWHGGCEQHQHAGGCNRRRCSRRGV
jgi:hypothetical protein